MPKVAILTALAVVAIAITAVLAAAPTPSRLSACDVDSRAEAQIWRQTNPGLGYIEACRSATR